MRKLSLLSLTVMMVMAMSVSAFAASTNGGTATLGVTVNVPVYGDFVVMDGAINETLGDPGSNTFTYEEKFRLRHTGDVDVNLISGGPLSNGSTDMDITLDINEGGNSLFTIGSGSYTGSAPVTGNGIHWYDATLTIPQWAAADWDAQTGWFDLANGAYSGNFVFTISAAE